MLSCVASPSSASSMISMALVFVFSYLKSFNFFFAKIELPIEAEVSYSTYSLS